MIELTRQDDVTVIELGPAYDSLDDAVLDEIGGLLLTKAATADPPLLLLDLSHTSFIGSSFLELLVRAWKRLSERGGALALCGLQPFCLEVLKTARLDTLWDCFSDRENAVETMARE